MRRGVKRQPRRGPTIVDVARQAGVSTAAVSFALNGRPGVGDATRARILAVAREVGWEPSASARSLRGRRAFTMGLVIARDPAVLSADPFFPRSSPGWRWSSPTLGQALLLQVVSDDAEREADATGNWRARSESTGSSSPTCVPRIRASSCWRSSGSPPSR